MAAFQHYLTRTEAVELLRDLARTFSLRLVPEVPVLVEPRIDTYEHVEPEVIEKLSAFPVVQLEGAFTRHPVAFARRDAGAAAGTYYIDDRIGPRLKWVLPGVATQRRPTLTPGSFGYARWFLDPSTGTYGPPDDELIACYRRVVRAMKGEMIAIERRRTKIWVGRAAKRQIDEGEAFIDLLS